MSAESNQAPAGDPALTARFYGELHALAVRTFASERRGHTLQPTAVVNEACLRLFTSSPLPEASRSDQLALAARVMRQVLVDHHRARSAEKRGGAALRLELDPELAPELAEGAGSTGSTVDFGAVHAALERLRALHVRQAEVVTLRIFGGLTMEQVAAALGVSKRTAEEDWAVARAWLRRELAESAA
jgi:RNA polymerase sigma factor (TIGR02999 family)